MAPAVLIQCDSVSKSFGVRPLFEQLNLVINEGDRVGLIGPNGAGKSTLLKILAGIEFPDSGERTLRKNLRIGYVPQNSVFEAGVTAEQAAVAGLEDLEHLDAGERTSRVALALGRVGFEDPAAAVDTLSGGWRTRLAIARELAREPEILLLDEPTNHLDVESIVWLEAWLTQSAETFVVVSHDRYFLERVVNQVVDLNPAYEGGLLKTAGRYSDALEASAEKLRHQDANREVLANKVRREVEWLRRGAKARTSKSKSRIQAAESSIRTLAESTERARTSTAGVDFNASGRKTKRLWYGEGLCKAFGDRRIVDDFELLLTPKSRLGVLGPNGSGKTTLLRMIVGDLKPDAGSIRTADALRVAYFDQRREALDLEASLRRALAPDGDSVLYLGREVHVVTWAHRFLFRTDQLDTPVSRLSGGERARIHLAGLMRRPADLLVLDEPTNDLDIQTLDVLEESLSEFPGAVVLVTHDRHLLDRVATQLLALDGTGKVEAFASVGQWLESRRKAEVAERRAKVARAAASRKSKKKKLSYMDQREFDSMETKVLEAESALEAAQAALADPAIASDGKELTERGIEAGRRQEVVDRLYERWAELEKLQKGERT